MNRFPRLQPLAMAITGMIFLTGAAGMPTTIAADAPAPIRVYFGTYTEGLSKGIYTGILDRQTGAVGHVALAAESKNPSFLAIHPNLKLLYAVNEVSDAGGKPTGAVSAFAIEPDSGLLRALNSQSSGGAGPCHITIDATGKTAFAANYGGGSVTSIPIAGDGPLGVPVSVMQHKGQGANAQRQTAPHAHSIYPDPTNMFVVSADLGLDQVLIYKFDVAKSLLTTHQPASVSVAPGAGPRHFAFHPNGKWGYVINELGNTVTCFQWDANKGTLTEFQTITTLPAGYAEKSYTAEVQIHPSGKFLYGSNRGHDSLAIFRIDTQTGKLTTVGQQPTKGKFPRNFGIDPSGNFVLAANQDSNSIVSFRVNQETGQLAEAGHVLEMGKPVCIKFLGK